MMQAEPQSLSLAVAFQIVVGILLTVAGSLMVYVWKEIISLRKSRQKHANILQRHVGRFARIGDVLHIEWNDLEDDLST
jgi:hypothetical protein